MRSTFAGLNTMYRGIVVNQLSLDTVGHNITNASTDGYSRQRVNQAATMAQKGYSSYGTVMIGTGTDAHSITRARNVYADKQYWNENATASYYAARQTNYDKIEAIFNDTNDSGVQSALGAFYSAWVDLSANASTASNRMTTIEQAKVFIDRLQTANRQVQDQITATYSDLQINVKHVNDLFEQIVDANKNISAIEAAGTNANDLRDKRDLLVDDLSQYISLSVYEDAETGMYQIVSDGVSLVNDITCLHLELADPIANKEYGITDYTLKIKETDTLFSPTDGSLKSQLDVVIEDKKYMDDMANMAAFLFTTFNEQHCAGYGISGNAVDIEKTNINFFGDNLGDERADSSTTKNSYEWDDLERILTVTYLDGGVTKSLEYKGTEIVNMLALNTKLLEEGGTDYVCAASGFLVEFTDGTKNPAVVEETAAATDVPSFTVTTDPATGRKTMISVEITDGKKITTTTVTDPNGTADGTNAVLISTLFNQPQDGCVNKITARSIGDVSLEAYYNAAMSSLGAASEAMDNMVIAQDTIILQVDTWRSSTAGVNWNEELTNMIMFQQGYGACSRCLTTMDEMLDKLINGTGVVGR